MFCGIAATMPPKMMIEIPFPIPSSVMIWPSHIASMVPAVMEAMITNVCNGYCPMPNSANTAPLPPLGRASNDAWPYACNAAIGIVSQLVY